MVTNREFLKACEVINTFCKEHNVYCGNCPMFGVCRVGIPNVTPKCFEDKDEVD